MISNANIDKAVSKVKKSVAGMQAPVLERFSDEIKDPYWVLIPCLLSLRAKDETTAVVARSLYERAPTMQAILSLKQEQLEKIIYKSGFYRAKARAILGTTKMIVEKFNGKVPDTIDRLLELPGVGRKTANLVVTVAFGKPGICVDTHVHKIWNRWGYVNTNSPDKTEMRLRQILPRKYWIKINYWLVLFGQSICLSVSPFCSRCPLNRICPKKGVKRFR